MSADKTALQSTLDEALKSLGFKRQASTWLRKTNDVIQLAELQKSQFGQQYYLNVGLWLTSLGELDKPREKDMHIRARLDALLSSIGQEELEKAMDLENDMSEAERAERFRHILNQSLLPRFQEWADAESLKRALTAGDFSRALVRKEAKEALS